MNRSYCVISSVKKEPLKERPLKEDPPKERPLKERPLNLCHILMIYDISQRDSVTNGPKNLTKNLTRRMNSNPL